MNLQNNEFIKINNIIENIFSSNEFIRSLVFITSCVEYSKAYLPCIGLFITWHCNRHVNAKIMLKILPFVIFPVVQC